MTKLVSDKNWTEMANKNFCEFFSKSQGGTLGIFEKMNFLEIIKFTKSFEPGAIYEIFSEVLKKIKTPSCSLSFQEQNDFF